MKKEPNIIFMGTPEFAARHLEALLKANKKVVGIISQPDRPAGRGRKIHPTHVKSVAIENNIPCVQPEKLANNIEILEWIKKANPDIIIVTAYGMLLPAYLLDSAPLGAWNIHASLLPKYRGAAPIQRAIMNGEKTTGITLMQMNTGLDTGDIIIQEAIEINENDTAGELTEKLISLGINVLLRGLELVENGHEIPRIPQNDVLSSYAPPLKKEDFEIKWEDSADNIHNKIRGLSPKPGARSGELKIIRSKLQTSEKVNASAGTILEISKNGISVATGKGIVLLTEVQPAGSKVMSAADFAHGRHLISGQLIPLN